MPEENENTNADTTTETSTTQDRNWRQLEEKATKQEEAAKKWRTKAIETVAASAGYDVSKGVTQSLIEKFDSEDVTADAFKAFAVGEGLNPHVEQNKTEVQERIVETLETLENGKASVESNVQTSSSTPPALKERMQEAQKEGRTADAIGLALLGDVIDHFGVKPG